MHRLKVITSLVLLTSVGIASGANAQVSVGSGGGSCSMTISNITRHWSDAKRAMLPLKADLRRAKPEHFYCVSPEYLRDAMEKRISPGTGLRCFSDTGGDGLGLCCDEGLRECARLRPDAVPEFTQKKKKKEPAYQKSNSDWVKPPSDKDQW